MRREEIVGNESTQMFLVKMSEGNPGAVTVCVEIMKAGGLLTLLHFDDMNIRGSQLWVAYKDFAKQDIQVLIEAAERRDPAMIEAVNKEIRHTGGHLAVHSGASFKRPVWQDHRV